MFTRQFLCADPSPLKIPDLATYLTAEFHAAFPKSIGHRSSRTEIFDTIGWLFSDEADLMLTSGNLICDDWEQGIKALLEK